MELGWDGEKQREEQDIGSIEKKQYLPWPCALLGKLETRASKTSGTHKHLLICPVENILISSSLILQRAKKKRS